MIRLIFIITFSNILGLILVAQEETGTESMNTVFTGDYLEMVSGDEISEFHLVGNVTVIGTNLNLTSDELHITAVKQGDKDATLTTMGKIMKIIAIGNVSIDQEGRIAESGRAEFFPEERKVLLTGNPVVTDAQGTVSGEEIEWFHGQRRALVRGGKQKVKVTLSTLPNLGYDPNAETDDNGEGEEQDETANETASDNPATP